MQEPRWTLDELAERVDMALAVDYHGQPSGRVRAVPDRRAIRWYTTIGLIDRPAAHRGRTALYGPRHLLQLVAVKRLQAKGLALVAIQQELAGATDSQLARVARLPLDGRPTVPFGPVPPAVAPRVAGVTARRAGFWRDRPVAAFTAAAAEAATDAAEAPVGSSDRPTGLGLRRPAPLQGLRLGAGATLLLEPGRELAAADLDAILAAAGPLLAVLRDRGLDGGPRTPNEARREHP
jgi:DNA-binding transcriptional MerR regulator